MKQFQYAAFSILDWIGTQQDCKLDMLYVDFMNEQFGSRKFAFQVDASNYQEKDLTPYIKQF